MADPIDFYFDLTSPYGYLASTRIEALATQFEREVNWHPLVLGFIFKTTGSQPLTQIPLKGEYAKMDMARSARQHGIPFQLPNPFPIGTVAAARACLWLACIDRQRSVDLIHALYTAYFVNNIDISVLENVIKTAASLGIDSNELSTALETPEVKMQLNTAVEDAIAKGIFGSPTIVVDDQSFWGHDRLHDVEHWLSSGGW